MITARVVMLATAAACLAYLGRAGDVVISEAGDYIGLVGENGVAPTQLNTTVPQIESVTGAVGAAGLARTLTLTITGLREGQRVGVLFTWGAPTAAETLAPSGATVQGDPVTAARGSVALLSGAADPSGVATCAVTLTASGAASFTTWATAMSPGVDIINSQTIAFA